MVLFVGVASRSIHNLCFYSSLHPTQDRALRGGWGRAPDHVICVRCCSTSFGLVGHDSRVGHSSQRRHLRSSVLLLRERPAPVQHRRHEQRCMHRPACVPLHGNGRLISSVVSAATTATGSCLQELCMRHRVRLRRIQAKHRSSDGQSWSVLSVLVHWLVGELPGWHRLRRTGGNLRRLLLAPYLFHVPIASASAAL